LLSRRWRRGVKAVNSYRRNNGLHDLYKNILRIVHRPASVVGACTELRSRGQFALNTASPSFCIPAAEVE
jgi:hypothetical protein